MKKIIIILMVLLSFFGCSEPKKIKIYEIPLSKIIIDDQVYYLDPNEKIVIEIQPEMSKAKEILLKI